MLGAHPEHRRKGYGRQILLAGMEELWEHGATRIALDVDAENRPAVGLYRSLGFAERYSYWWFEKARVSEPGAAGKAS